MIRSLRAYFLSRTFREKLILFGLLGIAVIMWATAYTSRATGFWRAQSATQRALNQQDDWLARKGQIEKATSHAVAQLDPAKTLDPANLWITVSQIGAESRLRNLQQLGSGAAMSSGQFSINTLRLQISNADWKDFATFYQKLQERSPYLAITDLTLRPVRSNPAQVQASMVIASFEIRH